MVAELLNQVPIDLRAAMLVNPAVDTIKAVDRKILSNLVTDSPLRPTAAVVPGTKGVPITLVTKSLPVKDK